MGAEQRLEFSALVGLSPSELQQDNYVQHQSGLTLSYLSALDDVYAAIWVATNP